MGRDSDDESGDGIVGVLVVWFWCLCWWWCWGGVSVRNGGRFQVMSLGLQVSLR